MLDGKDKVKLIQTTDYPWDGKITIDVEKAPAGKPFAINLRIPEWCDKALITINGKEFAGENKSNTYRVINRAWKKGDKVELLLDMPVKLIESNPLVEETRNQTTVKRGPLVYCLEAIDIEGGKNIDDVLIPSTMQFTTRKVLIAGSPVVVLDAKARLTNQASWKNTLYREVGKSNDTVRITLIPYYAWGNRGKADMTVWMPLIK